MLKVLLYKDKLDNPNYIFPEWPAESYIIKDDEEVTLPWLKMTENEFEDYRLQYQDQYDAHYNSFWFPKRDKEGKLRESHMNFYKKFKPYKDYESLGLELPTEAQKFKKEMEKLDLEMEKAKKLKPGDAI